MIHRLPKIGMFEFTVLKYSSHIGVFGDNYSDFM